MAARLPRLGGRTISAPPPSAGPARLRAPVVPAAPAAPAGPTLAARPPAPDPRTERPAPGHSIHPDYPPPRPARPAPTHSVQVDAPPPGPRTERPAPAHSLHVDAPDGAAVRYVPSSPDPGTVPEYDYHPDEPGPGSDVPEYDYHPDEPGPGYAPPPSRAAIPGMGSCGVLGGAEECASDSAQIFGPYAGAANNDLLNPSVAVLTVPVQGTACDRQWLVSSWAHEVFRETSPKTSLFADEIRAGTGGVASSQGRTRCEVEIEIQRGTGPEKYCVDVGQHLVLVGRSPKARVLAPAGTELVSAAAPITIVGYAFYFDALVSVSLVAVSDHPAHPAKCTRYLYQPANDGTVSIPIPPGARSCQIFQTTHGVASVEWRQMIAWEGASSPELHALPWAGRQTGLVSILPSATHLVPDVDVANARRFCAVFTIHQ